MLNQIDYETYNPFRRPDWRLERVLQIIDRPGRKPGRSCRRDDEHIRKLRNFLLLYRNGDDESRHELAYRLPGIYWAYQIHERRNHDKQHFALTLEARLLTKATYEQIAKDMPTVPDVVYWYELLFFNVRDRLNAYDWIVSHVLVPAYEASRVNNMPSPQQGGIAAGVNAAIGSFLRQPVAEPFYDSTMKFFAYFGGPIALDFVLSGFRRGLPVTSGEQLGEWFSEGTNTRIKHRTHAAAQTFEVNRYNVMQLFELHNQICTIEKNAQQQNLPTDQFHKAVAGVLREITWAAGDDGKRLIEGTSIEPYDNAAAELRDAEVQMMAAGEKPCTIDRLEHLFLPEPTRKNDSQEVVANADAQQGS